MTTLFLVVWLVCAFVAAGFLYADVQRVAPGNWFLTGLVSMVLSTAFGPIALLVAVIIAGITRRGWVVPFTVPMEQR